VRDVLVGPDRRCLGSPGTDRQATASLHRPSRTGRRPAGHGTAAVRRVRLTGPGLRTRGSWVLGQAASPNEPARARGHRLPGRDQYSQARLHRPLTADETQDLRPRPPVTFQGFVAVHRCAVAQVSALPCPPASALMCRGPERVAVPVAVVLPRARARHGDARSCAGRYSERLQPRPEHT
jgi:hypothetical protein